MSKTFGIALIAIGVFLAVFYGKFIKGREVGRGFENTAKRIYAYTAFGISALFIGGGLVFLILFP